MHAQPLGSKAEVLRRATQIQETTKISMLLVDVLPPLTCSGGMSEGSPRSVLQALQQDLQMRFSIVRNYGTSMDIGFNVLLTTLQRRHERGGVHAESPGAAAGAAADWRHPRLAAHLQLRPRAAVAHAEGRPEVVKQSGQQHANCLSTKMPSPRAGG